MSLIVHLFSLPYTHSICAEMIIRNAYVIIRNAYELLTADMAYLTTCITYSPTVNAVPVHYLLLCVLKR